MKKLLVLIAFSVLLLVPVGAQESFANHPQVLDCPENTFPSLGPTKGDLIQSGGSTALATSLTGSGPFCQDPRTIFDQLFPNDFCTSPYVHIEVIFIVNQPSLNYFACIAVPILVDDITHPDQCQGAAVLLNNHCFAQVLAAIGGALLDIDTTAVLVAAIGTDPIITGLVAITMAGVAGQAAWFIHKRKKNT